MDINSCAAWACASGFQPIGLYLLMGVDTRVQVADLVRYMREGCVVVVQAVFDKAR